MNRTRPRRGRRERVPWLARRLALAAIVAIAALVAWDPGARERERRIAELEELLARHRPVEAAPLGSPRPVGKLVVADLGTGRLDALHFAAVPPARRAERHDEVGAIVWLERDAKGTSCRATVVDVAGVASPVAFVIDEGGWSQSARRQRRAFDTRLREALAAMARRAAE